MTRRKVWPVQLLFKEYTWYLRAHCESRNAMRLFKVLRMKRVEVLEEVFDVTTLAEEEKQCEAQSYIKNGEKSREEARPEREEQKEARPEQKVARPEREEQKVVRPGREEQKAVRPEQEEQKEVRPEREEQKAVRSGREEQKAVRPEREE